MCSSIEIMNEVTINLLKRVIRTIEDDSQHEWLVDEINDYLNEVDLPVTLPAISLLMRVEREREKRDD